MSAPTTLRNQRLLLRPFVAADDVRRLADDLEIARNTLSIPPYLEGHAESGIESLQVDIAEGRSARAPRRAMILAWKDMSLYYSGR